MLLRLFSILNNKHRKKKLYNDLKNHPGVKKEKSEGNTSPFFTDIVLENADVRCSIVILIRICRASLRPNREIKCHWRTTSTAIDTKKERRKYYINVILSVEFPNLRRKLNDRTSATTL